MTNGEIKYINPYKIAQDQLPLIVFSDLSSGLVQWMIKWRTNSSWNHVMMMLWPGEFQSQGNIFSSVGIDRYMKKNSRLMFWKIKNLTGDETYIIRKRVMDRMNLPWWKRLYDYLGILGQATGLKWINNPWKPYCSEQVRDVLGGIIKIDLHPSPEDLIATFKQHPRLEEVGRWETK